MNKKSSSTLNLKGDDDDDNDSKNERDIDEPLILSSSQKKNNNNNELLERTTNSDLIIITTKEVENDNTKEIINSKLLNCQQNKSEKLNIKNCKCGEEFCTCTFKSVKPEEFYKKKLKKENCGGKNENDITFPTTTNNLSSFQSENYKSPTDNNYLIPNFKIGSEITNFFECENIKKSQQEIFDMSFSINSQISVPSCSSFLDTEDCSLLDVSDETLDFDEFETYNNNNIEKKECKFFNSNNDKSLLSNDFISLPSYGSVPYDALDLDNSIISIASLTSEMADSQHGQDFDIESIMYNSKNYHQMEDEDNKHFNVQSSMESINPNHTSEFNKELQINETKKKFTPKERRLASQDRYRTYTIRDFKGNYLMAGNKNEESVDKLEENKGKRFYQFLINALCYSPLIKFKLLR